MAGGPFYCDGCGSAGFGAEMHICGAKKLCLKCALAYTYESRTGLSAQDNDKRLDELRESLADYAHDAWAGWMEYLFAQCPKPTMESHDGYYLHLRALYDRWHRQMGTPYKDLPESEKESDRVEADKMLAIVRRGCRG